MTSVNKVIEIIEDITNYIIHDKNIKVSGPMKYCANISLLKKITKWKPKIKFEDGLKTTFEWYENNSSWWKNKISMQQIRIVMPDGKVLIH